MTDTQKEIEEFPLELEDIISRFEILSLTPASRSPLVVSEQHLDTERDLKD